MGEKRVIEQVASNVVHNDDWFLKDSPTQDTSKISATNLKAILGADGTLALEEIANAIVEEYNPSATYNKGAYVFYEGTFYKCKQNGTTGTWDASKWEATSVINLINSNAGDITELEYKSNNAIAINHSTIATYNKGDYVFYWFHLYRCLEDDVYGAWDDSKWEEVNILEYIDYVLENAGQVQDVTVDGTSVVTNKVAEIEIPVKDVQVKTDSTYDSVVDASGNAKIDLSSVTAYGSVPNLPQAIATFKDGADAPMPTLKVAIEPVQDLHGYDAPWDGGAGKNKLKVTATSETVNGVTFTVYDDGTIKVNGTASADVSKSVGTLTSNGSTYIGNGAPYGGDINLTYGMFFTYIGGDSGNGTYAVTVGEGNVITANINIKSGYNANNLLFKPMIRLASVTDATFAPYSNICPISGWDEVDVTVADDVENPTISNTYEIDLDGTRYGGEVDVVNGELTVKWIAVSLGNINYTKSQSGLFQTNEIANAVKKSSSSSAPTGFIKSSHFREIDSASITGPQGSNPSPDGVMAVSGSGMLYFNYWAVTDVADFKTAMASATLVYELATPLTIQLTPTQVKSLLGSNNVWADTGDINKCIYQRDMSSTIDDIIARLEALEG